MRTQNVIRARGLIAPSNDAVLAYWAFDYFQLYQCGSNRLKRELPANLSPSFSIERRNASPSTPWGCWYPVVVMTEYQLASVLQPGGAFSAVQGMPACTRKSRASAALF